MDFIVSLIGEVSFHEFCNRCTGGKKGRSDDVFALHFVASAKNRQVGGAYGIVSTMFFALYILLWNLEYATLGSFQWVESPATCGAKRQHQGSTESEIIVQAKNPIAGALVVLQPLWTILVFVFEKRASMVGNVLSFEFRVSFNRTFEIHLWRSAWGTTIDMMPASQPRLTCPRRGTR